MKDISIRVMRSATLLALWELLEKANQDYILAIAKAAGISEHKLQRYIDRVGRHDNSYKK